MSEIKDYHKTCWFCGKDTIKPSNSHHRCTSCGATFVDIPKPGIHTLQNQWTDELGRHHWHPIGKTS